MKTMFYTDNPARDYDRYDDYITQKLLRYPVCAECRERIQDDDLYDIDGELICESCMHSHKRTTSNYILEEER